MCGRFSLITSSEIKIVIIIFDQFTDIDLFLMWDILGRNKIDWNVRILGMKNQHLSSNGLLINTHGPISEANDADVVLFSSGRGTRQVLNDSSFLQAFKLDPKRQMIGSVCSGALILAKLGLLNNGYATTHPRAKLELQALGVKTLDKPLVLNGRVATAGGCLAAQYLVGWVVEAKCGPEKRKEMLREILPVGQFEIYEALISSSIQDAKS